MTPLVDNRVLWVDSAGLGYLRIHKAACMALTEALEHDDKGDKRPVQPQWYRKPEWRECRRERLLVVMLRNPWDRQESMYRFFVDKGNIGGPISQEGFERWLLGLTEEQIRVEPHFSPQYWHCCDEGEFLPDIRLRWDFSAFERLFGVEVSKRHASTPFPLEWTLDMRNHFKELYLADLELWG